MFGMGAYMCAGARPEVKGGPYRFESYMLGGLRTLAAHADGLRKDVPTCRENAGLYCVAGVMPLELAPPRGDDAMGLAVRPPMDGIV